MMKSDSVASLGRKQHDSATKASKWMSNFNPIKLAMSAITKLTKPKTDMREHAHVKHREWLDKIEYLWKQLDKYHNSECV